ncbi:MAG TPA: membrane protein insertion efficiency factor YidD [Polyangiaceae bacterium]|nr:membrane protein insertion efficiency factor YidD [Polyangiaceae bacterium]
MSSQLSSPSRATEEQREQELLDAALSQARTGLVTRALLGAIRLYQLLLSPYFGQVCRFHPSCSRYTAECLCLHGPLKGSYLGMRRLLRCHPFHPGGVDLPPRPVARAPQGH